MKKVLYKLRVLCYNKHVSNNMTKLQYLEEDCKSIAKSIAFHESRIENFGKPQPKGRIRPFDDVNPEHLLPRLRKILKEMKQDIKRIKEANQAKKKNVN
jgi:hypothetical protein